MNSRIVRLVALALCLVVPLGWSTLARADTTATVSVTGQVVDTSMSLSFDRTSFSFGSIDATGNAYNAGTSLAQPFAIGANPYGYPQGTAWFARTPLMVTVTNPVTADLRACLTTQTNVIDAGGSHLFMPISTPADYGGDPVEYIAGTNLPDCQVGYFAGFRVPPSVNVEFGLYPTYLVRATDTPTTFSATIQFMFTAL